MNRVSVAIDSAVATMKPTAVKAIVIMLLVSSLDALAYGGHYFRSLRDDLTIPQYCKDLELDHFEKEKINFFTYSISGGKRRGFDHEYEMKRNQAKDLWRYIKRHMDGGVVDTDKGQFAKDPSLKRYFHILKDNYEPMDFNFGSEGEILELLVIKKLQADVGDDFYVYGSVQYADRRAGELDLIVAKKTDCSIVGIGEAKLGVRSLSRAKKQLNRFYDFLVSHVRNGLELVELSLPGWY